MPSGDVQVQQGAGPSNAGVPEQLAVGTYRRVFAGPKRNDHFSIQVFVDQAGGAGSTATVWYSNHPNPSAASDSDWTQDTTITAPDLTTTTSKFVTVGNVDCEYVMLKVVVGVSQANIRAFVRVEGTGHGMA
jgi:hypothetical protein